MVWSVPTLVCHSSLTPFDGPPNLLEVHRLIDPFQNVFGSDPSPTPTLVPIQKPLTQIPRRQLVGPLTSLDWPKGRTTYQPDDSRARYRHSHLFSTDDQRGRSGDNRRDPPGTTVHGSGNVLDDKSSLVRGRTTPPTLGSPVLVYDRSDR